MGDATSPTPGKQIPFYPPNYRPSPPSDSPTRREGRLLVASEGQSSPGPSPRRWLRSKVASAAAGGRVPQRFCWKRGKRGHPRPLRHIALTIALVSFRKNSSLVVTGGRNKCIEASTCTHTQCLDRPRPMIYASADTGLLLNSSILYRLAGVSDQLARVGNRRRQHAARVEPPHTNRVAKMPIHKNRQRCQVLKNGGLLQKWRAL
jgi:hypothetical protein